MIDYGKDVKILWQDTKRIMGMPISFTHYAIIQKPGVWTKLVVQQGVLSTAVEEIHCYRIDDISYFQNLFGSFWGVGNITVFCNDASCNKVLLQNVKNPAKVRMLLNDIVEEERAKKNIRYVENPNK